MGFWFWLKNSHSEQDYVYELQKVTLNNLSYRPSHYFEESSTFKLFKVVNFSIEVFGFYNDRNQIPSCTLYLTDDERIRISIIIDQSRVERLVQDLKSKEKQNLRFCITDNKSLEECCMNLLSGGYKSSTFVKNIDSFWIGSISSENRG